MLRRHLFGGASARRLYHCETILVHNRLFLLEMLDAAVPVGAGYIIPKLGPAAATVVTIVTAIAIVRTASTRIPRRAAANPNNALRGTVGRARRARSTRSVARHDLEV